MDKNDGIINDSLRKRIMTKSRKRRMERGHLPPSRCYHGSKRAAANATLGRILSPSLLLASCAPPSGPTYPLHARARPGSRPYCFSDFDNKSRCSKGWCCCRLLLRGRKVFNKG